jgi:hypothetical protein
VGAAQALSEAVASSGAGVSIFLQRTFWLNLAGASIAAVFAATPILMSGVMDRGFEIAKQSVAEPLAILAFGAVLLSGAWRSLQQQGAATKIAASSLVAFLLLAIVSTALSDNPEVAIFGGYYRREGLLAWCVYGGFFFAVLGWARSAERITDLLDVLLLSSVIPAAYALQQRLGLDFYPLGLRDLSRPGGTMGSPVFLAAYLGVLLPLSVVRCWQVRRALPQFGLWLMVAIVQLCGLLVTQSRGPLLAVLFGSLMIACSAAAGVRARRIFLMLFVFLGITAVSVIAINTHTGARQWAQDLPVVNRLVFNLGRDAAFSTRLASRSAAARLAIWGAGAETFAAAPLASKLLGYGPETAYMYYFPYMPASVMRLVGFGAYNTYDRMHADTLDIGLNFGLLAWLVYCLFFGTVMYTAARTLWDLSGRMPCYLFIVASCGGGVLACLAAVLAGFSSAAVPAFGLGISAGWFLFMAGCAWRALGHGIRTTSARQTTRWTLLVGLCAALWIFWSDAQINIPVLTTRLISFAIAALILIVADGFASSVEKEADTESVPANELLFWGIACALVATCAICLPVTTPNANAGVQDAYWLRRMLPIAYLVFTSMLAAGVFARCSDVDGAGTVRSWLALVVGAPLLYSAAHFACMVNVGAGTSFDQVCYISMASIAGAVFIGGLCIAFALRMNRRTVSSTNAIRISRLARWSTCVVAVAVSLVAATEWRATRADVASSLAQQALATQRTLAEQLVGEAIRLSPYERYYRRQLVFDLLGNAVADIRRLGASPDRIPAMMRNLAAAETVARTAAILFPRDPWVVVALANVLQIRALRVLRPLDPVGGLRAAAEADQLFARTHRMFPSEPLLLRNWAELQADQGNLLAAYSLLDRMEALIPNDPEPYFARIAIAKQAFDRLAIFSTVARAKSALEAPAYERLLAVASEQQN